MTEPTEESLDCHRADHSCVLVGPRPRRRSNAMRNSSASLPIPNRRIVALADNVLALDGSLLRARDRLLSSVLSDYTDYQIGRLKLVRRFLYFQIKFSSQSLVESLERRVLFLSAHLITKLQANLAQAESSVQAIRI